MAATADQGRIGRPRPASCRAPARVLAGDTRPNSSASRGGDRRKRKQSLLGAGSPLAGSGCGWKTANHFLNSSRSPYAYSGNEAAKDKLRALCGGKTGPQKHRPEKEMGDVRFMLPWGSNTYRLEKRVGAEDLSTDTSTNPTFLEQNKRTSDALNRASGKTHKPGREPFIIGKDSARFQEESSLSQTCSLYEQPQLDGETDTPIVHGLPSLFQTTQPTIPTVNQYIPKENLMYEAIRKRGQGGVLAKNMGGLLSFEQKGGTPWADMKGGEYVEDIEPSALLYADEDIDKVCLLQHTLGLRKFMHFIVLIKMLHIAGRVALAMEGG